MEITQFVAGPLDTNAYLLTEEQHAVVIDAGFGAAAQIRPVLEENNLELDAVIATHGHVDHVRDAVILASEYSVPLYIHPDDSQMLFEPELLGSDIVSLFEAQDMPRNYTYMRDLSEGRDLSLLGTPAIVHHLPGHSPGCATVTVHPDKGDPIVFSGDVLFNNGVGRTDLPGSDPEAMQISLRRLPELFTRESVVLPGHGPSTTIVQELDNNPFLPR